MKSTICTLIVGIMAVIMIGMYCHIAHSTPLRATHSPAQTTAAPVKQIMSIRETQTALNAQGHSRYKCKVDGKWGPETAKALDNFICDRNYKESTYANTQLK